MIELVTRLDVDQAPDARSRPLQVPPWFSSALDGEPEGVSLE